MEIHETNITEAWKAAIKHVLESGNPFQDHDNRTCIETLGLTIKIDDTQDAKHPIELLKTKFQWVYPEYEELAQAIMGEEEFLNNNRTYGHRIFHYGNVLDQARQYVIPLLKRNPQTRRAIISLYNPLQDSDLKEKNQVSLCTIFFKLHEGKLHVSYFLRSSDLFMGWPANTFQLSVLQEFISKALGVIPGTLTAFCGSAHVFEEQRKDIIRVTKGI